MVLHDLLYRAIPRVATGDLEPRLSDHDRAVAVWRLQGALHVLGDFGATPKEDLIRMFAVPSVDGQVVADAVARVISGLA